MRSREGKKLAVPYGNVRREQRWIANTMPSTLSAGGGNRLVISVLTARRWQAAFDLAGELAGVGNAADFISAATAGMQAALDIDVAAYCVWHPRSRRAGRVIIAPEFSRPSADQAHVWEQHHPEDLWISHATRTGDPRAVRLTEIASGPELSASPTYQSCYRPSGFRFMAHLPLALEPGTKHL